MERCETCAHWRQPFKWEEPALGACEAVRFKGDIQLEATKEIDGDDYDYDREVALASAAFGRAKAYAQDAEGYHASLRTGADFGCILHEPKFP